MLKKVHINSFQFSVRSPLFYVLSFFSLFYSSLFVPFTFLLSFFLTYLFHPNPHDPNPGPTHLTQPHSNAPPIHPAPLYPSFNRQFFAGRMIKLVNITYVSPSSSWSAARWHSEADKRLIVATLSLINLGSGLMGVLGNSGSGTKSH